MDLKSSLVICLYMLVIGITRAQLDDLEVVGNLMSRPNNKLLKKGASPTYTAYWAVHTTYGDTTKGQWRRSKAIHRENHWEVTFQCEAPTANNTTNLTWQINGTVFDQQPDNTVITRQTLNGQVFSNLTLTNFNWSQHSEYGCLTTDLEPGLSNFISYSTVVAPKTSAVLPISNNYVANITLGCWAPPSTTLYWKIPAPLLSHTDVSEYFDSATNSQVSNITIWMEKANQYMVFECCAEHPDKIPFYIDECARIGIMEGPPTAVEHNIDCSDTENGCTLSCSFQGAIQQYSPTGSIYWTLCTTTTCINATGSVEWPVNNYELVMTVKHVKNYKSASCNAINPFGNGNYTFNLGYYEKAPTLNISTSSYRKADNKVVFTCVIDDYPHNADVQWLAYSKFRQTIGEQVYTSTSHPDDVQISTFKNSYSQTVTTLEIPMWSSWVDYTTFSCRSNNSFGSFTSIPIEYQDYLMLDLKVSSHTPWPGEKVTVNCSVQLQENPTQLVVEVGAPKTLDFKAVRVESNEVNNSILQFTARKKKTPVYVRCYYNDFGRTDYSYIETRIDVRQQCRPKN